MARSEPLLPNAGIVPGASTSTACAARCSGLDDRPHGPGAGGRPGPDRDPLHGPARVAQIVVVADDDRWLRPRSPRPTGS